MRRVFAFALTLIIALALPASAQYRVAPTVAKVVVNTSAADFTVVAAQAGKSLRVRHLDAQNIGTAAKVTLLLCDGTCGTAGNIKYSWQLSAATTTTMGGGWTLAPAAVTGEWTLTAGSALIARVDTGATNNVTITVTYHAE